MKHKAMVFALLILMAFTETSCTTAMNANEAHKKAGKTYATMYPSRGQINVYAPSKNGGYTTSRIRTYSTSKPDNLYSVCVRGVSDLLTLGLFSALN